MTSVPAAPIPAATAHVAPEEAVPAQVAPGAPGVAPRSRLSAVDLAVLALIGIVVLLVSLPKLRLFALHENESDAIRTLRVLADDALASADLDAPSKLADLVAAPSAKSARLEDLEVLANGRLRQHGYVFDWIAGDEGGSAIVAWPWEHGRTGVAVFAIEPGGPVLGLANEDGRYSGPRRPPPPPSHAPRAGESLAWTPLSAN
jgi:hypothetical protein